MQTQIVCAAVLAAGLLPSPALADTATVGEPLGAAAGLETVVVTAQIRSQTAQTVPLSLNVIAGDELAQLGVKDLFQAVPLIPGVVFSRPPDDGLALTFRGLGTAARSQAFEQSVGLFTDGVFMGKGRLYTNAFFDVNRIEFIKGTQSTLLGKNASLGAISIVDRQPGDSYSFETREGYEFANGGYIFDAAGDIPVSDDAALRLAAHYNDLDGWVHNDLTDHNGPEHKDLGLRATVRDNITATLTATVSYQYEDNTQIGASYQLVGALPASYGDGLLNDRASEFTSDTDNGNTVHNTKSHIAYAKVEWQIGDDMLSSQSSYVHYDLANVDDMDFSIDNTVNFLRDEQYSQSSEEIRLQSPTNQTLDYLAGIFYMDSHWNSLENQLWTVPAFPPPPSPISGQLFNGPFSNHFVQDLNNYSAFASGTWHLSGRWRLTGGIRYTREDKNVVYGRTNSAPFTIWNTIANPPFDPTPLKHSSSFLDGNASVEYDVAKDMMVYASFAHGSKSGGFVETSTVAIDPALLVNGKVPPPLVAEGSALKDESAKTYELGLKSTLLDNRLRFNIDAFHTDVANFQDTVFTGGTLGFITFNGPVQSSGFESDIALEPVPGLLLDGGTTYANATGVIQPIDPSTNAPEVDAAGNPVYASYRRSQAPLWTANLDARYDRIVEGGLDLWAAAGLRYRSSMFNQRQDEFPSKELTTLNLSVGLESTEGHWGVEVAVTNLTNAISQDFASPSVDPRFTAFYGAYLAGPNPSRTAMVSFQYAY